MAGRVTDTQRSRARIRRDAAFAAGKPGLATARGSPAARGRAGLFCQHHCSAAPPGSPRSTTQHPHERRRTAPSATVAHSAGSHEPAKR